MKTRKVKCPVCGKHNWSGKEYCVKCSGELYFDKNNVDNDHPLHKAV